MSQTTLLVWTALLVLGTVTFTIIAVGFAQNHIKAKKHLAHLYDKLGEHKVQLDKLESNLLKRASELNRNEERLTPLYSYVIFSEEDSSRLAGSLPSVTRKKLAQRIGYKIIQRFKNSIREVPDTRGRAFRLDINVAPKE